MKIINYNCVVNGGEGLKKAVKPGSETSHSSVTLYAQHMSSHVQVGSETCTGDMCSELLKK